MMFQISMFCSTLFVPLNTMASILQTAKTAKILFNCYNERFIILISSINVVNGVMRGRAVICRAAEMQQTSVSIKLG